MPQICFRYVDNDPDACTILSSFCERIGTLTIKTLNSGEAALEWLATSNADVIVSDYRMPGGMDGMLLLRTLHARGNTTPFIFFSATDDPAARKKPLMRGHSVLSGGTLRAGAPSTRSSGRCSGQWDIPGRPAPRNDPIMRNTVPETPDPGSPFGEPCSREEQEVCKSTGRREKSTSAFHRPSHLHPSTSLFSPDVCCRPDTGSRQSSCRARG